MQSLGTRIQMDPGLTYCETDSDDDGDGGGGGGRGGTKNRNGYKQNRHDELPPVRGGIC